MFKESKQPSSEKKSEITESEVPSALDDKDNKEFQFIKNEWKFNYTLMLKKESQEMTAFEKKQRINEDMKKTNDLINKIKSDHPEFSDDHQDITKYKAQLRALYELLNFNV